MIPVPNLDLMKKGLRRQGNLREHQSIPYVPNLDLMKKGLRHMDDPGQEHIEEVVSVPNLDLMKKGLRLYKSSTPQAVNFPFQT